MDIPEEAYVNAWLDAQQDAIADVANHPLSVQLLEAWFASGLEAGAEWARKQTLEEAEKAIVDCGYVLDGDRIAFPSGRAADRHEVVNAIRALGEAR